MFYGVGVNIFRGGIEYSPKAKKALQSTINQSKAFGIRNDGSYDKLKNWIGLDVSKVDIVPDPGLLHLDRFNIERKETVSVLGFQPAINKSRGINNNRFANEFNLEIIKDYFKADISLPHTISDFTFGHPVIPKHEFINKYRVFENLDKFLGKYKLVDYVIAMRGHGQMISIGLNIPGIYLSTQDKVRDFSVNNGFENYDVDIREPNTPPFVIVKLPPISSSTVSLPSRPLIASSLMPFSMSAKPSVSQSFSTGVTRPRGVDTAMLMSK